MQKLAIIGASYLQNPLILKAKEMGLETHVFAWQCGDIGETTADYFYPISIVEKDEIAQKCREIGIDGIVTIATDLGVITVNYVANQLGLPGNTMECTALSTNKHLMRGAFEKCGDPSPRSIQVTGVQEAGQLALTYPIIVKPTDRSGSRGIFKLESPDGLEAAVNAAMAQGFEKKALAEEFAEGREYSVECVSFDGEHHFLAMTQKYNTGAPHFIETGHLEPAQVSEETLQQVKQVVFHALNTLKIRNGASHSEVKIDSEGNIRIIEIGGRMGGDCIGSDLVFLSTGIDFVKAVIQIALGQEPDGLEAVRNKAAGIRFVFSQKDLDALERLKCEHPEYLVREDNMQPVCGEVADSSARFGAYLMCAPTVDALLPYLPEDKL